MPKKISSGSISVKVTQYGDGRWCVYWNEDGKQRRLIRMTEKEAVKAARAEIERMRAGIGAVGRHHLMDLAYIVPMLESYKITLREMAQQWEQMVSHINSEKFQTDPEEVINKFLEHKRIEGVSEGYLKGLRIDTGRIANSWPHPLAALTSDDLQALLDRYGQSPRHKKNVLTNWRVLFKWAFKHGYLPEKWDELSKVVIPRELVKDIAIYSPHELRKLLEMAPESVRPFIALGAWTGLRSAEIDRLVWPDVRDDHIVVTARNAKTGSRRIVPVLGPVLKYLDRDYQKPSPLQSDVYRRAVEAGMKAHWKRNALRHSWISYRLAIVEDVQKVALEAGNSPQIIFRHYRELVTRKQAEAWFGME